MLATFETILPDPKTRVVIIASGLKDFSVGGDLSKMDTLTDPKAARARSCCSHMVMPSMPGAMNMSRSG